MYSDLGRPLTLYEHAYPNSQMWKALRTEKLLRFHVMDNFLKKLEKSQEGTKVGDKAANESTQKQLIDNKFREQDREQPDTPSRYKEKIEKEGDTDIKLVITKQLFRSD
ncbi:unnamed protein product [Dovyalis caffra]|uniref:Uncharacterized protein n=1 Tax=Dovyalis caffra TaxID=77055 RepID=A0AAV1RZ40_9ROSI|nr:unnamed protein product [Dovyalis caffra]